MVVNHEVFVGQCVSVCLTKVQRRVGKNARTFEEEGAAVDAHFTIPPSLFFVSCTICLI